MIAVDASTPPLAGGSSGATVTTASFSPPAGSLLVLFVNNAAGSSGASSLTDSLASHLTYRKLTGVSAGGGTGNGASEIWVAQVPATAPGAMTVTLNLAGSSFGFSLGVIVLTGAAAASAQTGATATGHAGSGNPSVTVTTTAPNSLALACFTDFNARTVTIPSGQTVTFNGNTFFYYSPNSFEMWVQGLSAGSTPASGTSVTINDTDNTQWTGAAVEILAAASSSSAAVSDTLSLSDSVTTTAAHHAAGGDIIALADITATAAAHHTAVADTLTLADAATSNGPHQAAAGDTLTLADATASSTAHHASAGDSIPLADIVTVGPRPHNSTAADTLNLADGAAATATLYANVASMFLSPYGCFTGQVPDGDSHYDTLKSTLGDPFVIQWKSAPRQLESGAFPGALIPRVREGRDTDFVFDASQAENPQETSKAEDNATAVIAQAQGLGGASSGNLTAEAFNFEAIEAHPLVLSEAEQLPATSELNMLVLQLETLLGLRSNVWQDVSADSTGLRQMQDTFPLTGALAEFDWAVGDGIRLNLPQVGVVDVTPRQIIALKRMLYPDGMGANTASFRGRPRDFVQTMRKFIRQVYADRRTFQGQLTHVSSNTASETR